MTNTKVDWNEGDWSSALDEAANGGYRWAGDEEEPREVKPTDIAETLYAYEGTNDEDAWLAVVRMVDGHFAFIEASCDYTGWSCQASGSISYAVSVEELCRFSMDALQRHRLRLDIFGKETGT
jgi:hypothetical protein